MIQNNKNMCYSYETNIFYYYMLSWIIQIIIISVLFIFLVHHLIAFFKNTLTIPKTKDLITSTNKKYDDIFSILNSNNRNTNNYNYNIENGYLNTINDGTSIDLLPAPSDVSMKDELKNFLKNQLNENGENYFL